MPEEFKAIVIETHDETPRKKNLDHHQASFSTEGLKSARFVLQNVKECPWPPLVILGKTVRVIVED